MSFIYLHNSLVKKYSLRPMKRILRQYARGSLIDIGCGERPFYDLLKGRISNYVGVDHQETPHDINCADIISSAYNIPVDNESFDTILISQVIEHLEEPNEAFNEMYRIIRKGGKVILSWPFLYPMHEEPRDFYRYTPYTIEYIANKTGFKVIQIAPVSGFFITFFSFLSIFIGHKSLILYIILYPFLLIFKYLCIGLEFIDRNKKGKSRWTWNYLAVLEKL